MKNQRCIARRTAGYTRLLAPLALVCLLTNMAAAAGGPTPDTPPIGQKAGKITALLPTAHVIRGAGKAAVTTDAKKGDELVWQDLVKTDKGGRARITLNDQSILSLGSQAELRIIKQDASAQQTSLEMNYGRVRAQVEKVTRDGGSFQVRTPTAVAGVIGTDFGTDASEPGVTTFICISGLVQVGNADPHIPGNVPCAAGQTTTVKSGMPPTPPKPATAQQINQLIEDTEPATISAFAPASGLIGTTLDAVATGTHMGGIKGVTVAGAGIQASLGPNGTATNATAHLAISSSAQPGPHTLTFTKPNGANTAAIFTVIAPVAPQGTDAASLKKRYTDILTAEQQAAQSSDAGIKAGLQQEIDIALQAIQASNSRLPQPLPADQVTQQFETAVNSLNLSNFQNQEAQAYGNASTGIDGIVAAIESKLASNSEPAANLLPDLDKAFAPINQAYLAALTQVHTDFAQQSQALIASIDQLSEKFQQTLAAASQQQLGVPNPKVDSTDRTAEVGVQASFDASGSSAANGASIASTSWVLCDSSYRPGQVGVLLPGNAPGCTAVPGFASSGGAFQINTCTLNPVDYVARVTVTDSNGKSSAMDVRLHVTQPGYDDPPTRLQSLANAYTSLQQQQFLSFFDPNFPGYTQLQENIRNTFFNLNSMQINLRVSQSQITCNDATVRADWQQIYTFKNDPLQLTTHQQEQLTARMTRVPGKGWFITDFQGDNGTVQGVAPGPQTTFIAQPSLQVTNLVVLASAQPQQQEQARDRRSVVHDSASGSITVDLPPGTDTFQATVTNIGNAPLTQDPQLRFSIFDSGNHEIAFDIAHITNLPLNPGDSTTINGTLTVNLPISTPVTISANVNPGCQIQEQNCGAKDTNSVPAQVATPAANYVIASIGSALTPNPPTGANALQDGQNVDVRVTVANIGSSSPAGNIVLQLSCTGGQCGFNGQNPTATVAAPAAGQSVIADFFPGTLDLAPATGLYVARADILSAPPESSTADNSQTLAFDVTDFSLNNQSAINGDLNVRLGTTGVFNLNLAEPQGLTPVNIPITVGPAIPGVNFSFNSTITAGSTQPIGIVASNSAPAGTSAVVTVTGTRFGIPRTAAQSVHFYTASLDNFSPGQPGNNINQPIILQINGPAQQLQLKMNGTFSIPSGGAQLVFPTITGINFQPSATIAAPGDVIDVQIVGVQGAALNQTIPVTVKALIPNTNPQDSVSVIIFVRPVLLPDLAVTAVQVPARNFSTNPWLSGEPLDFTVTVANQGQGATTGNEGLHFFLNGQELTKNVRLTQSIPAGSSVNVPIHLDAPDPVGGGTSSVVVSVDEDFVGDLNPSNDSFTLASGISTSDWTIVVDPTRAQGSSDSFALQVPSGQSNATTIIPAVASGGSFLTPITIANRAVSSRITGTLAAGTFNSAAPIPYAITANATAASGLYVAQVVASFSDAGRFTAQRSATVHVLVNNPANAGDTVTITSDRNNACGTSCPAPATVQINGLLVEDLNLTATRAGGTTGTVDLHFTDPPNVVSNVTQSGNAQSSILNGVAYGAPQHLYFAGGQDASFGTLFSGPGVVLVSATSIQTSAVNGGPTPDPVGASTQLQFQVGDLLPNFPSCVNIPPGQSGTAQMTFTPVSGFNAAVSNWMVVSSSLPPGIVVGGVTPSSPAGGPYAVNIGLTNNNVTDIVDPQILTLVGTITNQNGSATVSFQVFAQFHSGACVQLGGRNLSVAGGSSIPGGAARGVWHRGASAGIAAARATVIQTASAAGDLRLMPGEASYSPAMPKAGDTVQVRFRMSNPGKVDVRGMQIGLVINGVVVASDTVDLAAGRTSLGGLQWSNAQMPRSVGMANLINAKLVVDPIRNSSAAISSGKVAPLAHFALTGGIGGSAGPALASAGGSQRARIEIAESACAGFRFSSGASASCSPSDVEISFDDAATGRFSLNASRGIVDLGMGYVHSVSPNLQFASTARAMAGHSYAVQLTGGKVGVMTIRQIMNPRQRAAAADKAFRGGAAARMTRTFGRVSGPVQTGDVSGVAARNNTMAVLDVLYDTP